MSVQLEDVYLDTQHDRGEIHCIQDCQNEIKKQSLTLTRLTKLLIEKKLDPEIYIKITQEYIDKLQNNMEIRALYLNKIQKESHVNEELKTVLENKELLEARKKIGDICEEEYEIKIAALNWDINNLNEKQYHQKKSLELLQGSSNQMQAEVLEIIRNLSKDTESALKNMDFDPEICEKVTQNIEILTKIIS